MKQKKFDAIIIGFGKGGKTLAGKLAQAGKTVAGYTQVYDFGGIMDWPYETVSGMSE